MSRHVDIEEQHGLSRDECEEDIFDDRPFPGMDKLDEKGVERVEDRAREHYKQERSAA